jgi:hypothetical protein
VCAPVLQKSLWSSVDTLAHFVRKKALAGTVIHRDGEIACCTHSQAVLSRACAEGESHGLVVDGGIEPGGYPQSGGGPSVTAQGPATASDACRRGSRPDTASKRNRELIGCIQIAFSRSLLYID